MSDSKVYRFCRISSNSGFKCALEALHGDAWVEAKSWTDPGALAAFMVKNGVAADHASALALINRAS